MSEVNKSLVAEFQAYLDKKEAFLDAYIETGTDHELFLASYIHGHFSVIAARLLNAINDTINEAYLISDWKELTDKLLTDSIDKAIANNELTTEDTKDVLLMRESLLKL